ncbi:Eukaryotic translation initiation factor 5A [Clydaea vesicula]|uniref:Eukaryotic translation initiation factor 5A n=1 Tax=Clydaea vesicula TaxID=447962 RepID=A0AAD5U7X1_9FUNG|nr:Eukaryotic translation initiation factor 5A [Clydaea vesicula]
MVGHGKDINDIDVSFDNSKFCSASSDRSIFLWDGQIIKRFSGHDQRVSSCALNKDGSVICSGSYDATIRLWDCRSQNRLPIQIISDSKDDVSSVDLSDTEILAGSIDNFVRIYDLRQGKMIEDNLGHPVTSATFSGDGQCVLASTLDSTIQLLDKESGEVLNSYSGHINGSYKISSCLNSADSHVISGSEDGSIFVWDLAEGNLIESFHAHKKVVESVVYHPTKDLIISGSSDSTIKSEDKDAHLDEVFETTDAGASLVYPLQCSALRKGGHVVIKGRPCKIVDMSTSKTGKHGHAKVHLVAIDIFTGKKLEDISPSTHNMEVPHVKRTEYTLLDIDDGFLNLMTADGGTKEDVKLPDGEIGNKIQAEFDEGKDLIITVVASMGEEMCLGYKDAPKQ